MKVTEKTIYPYLAKQFRNYAEIADLIFCSERTVGRRMTGRLPFKEIEIRAIEEYTGISRKELFKRR